MDHDGATTLARRILMILAAAPYALNWAELRQITGWDDDRELLDAAEALAATGLVETRRGQWAISGSAPGAPLWAEVAGDAAFGAARLRRDVPNEVNLALAIAGPEPEVADAAWRMLVIAHRENTPEDVAALLRLLAEAPEAEPPQRSRRAEVARRLGLLPPGHDDNDLVRRKARLKLLLDRVGAPAEV